MDITDDTDTDSRLSTVDRQRSEHIRAIHARLGGAFRLRGAAKRRYGATTAGEARVIRGE